MDVVKHVITVVILKHDLIGLIFNESVEWNWFSFCLGPSQKTPGNVSESSDGLKLIHSERERDCYLRQPFAEVEIKSIKLVHKTKCSAKLTNVTDDVWEHVF